MTARKTRRTRKSSPLAAKNAKAKNTQAETSEAETPEAEPAPESTDEAAPEPKPDEKESYRKRMRKLPPHKRLLANVTYQIRLVGKVHTTVEGWAEQVRNTPEGSTPAPHRSAICDMAANIAWALGSLNEMKAKLETLPEDFKPPKVSKGKRVALAIEPGMKVAVVAKHVADFEEAYTADELSDMTVAPDSGKKLVKAKTKAGNPWMGPVRFLKKV